MRGPAAPTSAVRRAMQQQAVKDTKPEVRLRKQLFAAGLRYRVGYQVPGQRRRTIDIAFPGPRLAVFVDGCFWHGCPEHCVQPMHNAEWWQEKLDANRERDKETTRMLQRQGWTVVRIWEHQIGSELPAAVQSVIEAHRDCAQPGEMPAPGA